MDTYILVAMGVGLAIAVWYFILREDDKPEIKNPPVDPNTVPGSTNVGRKAEGTIPQKAKLSVPAGADKMTKAQIEAEARAQGVELDKRKTKANMLAEWKQAIK